MSESQDALPPAFQKLAISNLMAQVVIFLLGWPLEWTEIILISMPIFVPLLPHFGSTPCFLDSWLP